MSADYAQTSVTDSLRASNYKVVWSTFFWKIRKNFWRKMQAATTGIGLCVFLKMRRVSIWMSYGVANLHRAFFGIQIFPL